jgi:predicted phage terminase large subunit-like protein
MPKWTSYIPITPTPKQAIFLSRPEREGLFGGAAGGGKTVALLACLLQYVDVPGYHGLGLRRTYSDLSLPGGLMDLAHQWLDGTDARWNDKAKTWRFPSSATVTFGYCQHLRDERRYKGPEFQTIVWDELTEFAAEQYEFLMTRLRKPKGLAVPLRVRCGSNPGGVGHAWVKEHFIAFRDRDRIFIPSLYLDNPHLDYDEYTASMSRINPILREQMLRGNWDIQAGGKLLKREWFPYGTFPRLCRRVRYWDMAATDEEEARRRKRRADPDYTVGVLMGEAAGRFGVLDVRRYRRSAGDVETLIRQVAALDGPGTVIGMEQEPGSSGKAVVDRYRRDVLRGFSFYPCPSSGSKIVRAVPFAAAAEHGEVVLAPCYENNSWMADYLDEIALFPHGVHDDQVDASSGAFNMLAPGQGRGEMGAGDVIGARQVIPSLGMMDYETEIPGL